MNWPESTPQREALERLFSRISDVTTLPQIAQRVLTVARDENATNEDLRRVIQHDPALVARVLRRVNSSMYGLPHRVADLSKAIVLLGFREIQAMALTVFVSKMFDSQRLPGNFSREALWGHSIGVAVMARLIASVCGLPRPDEAYVAGLLHDLGYILLDQHLPTHFARVVDALETSKPTYDVEQRLLTFDHALLGAYVAQRWNFPDEIVDAIGYHHQLSQYKGEHVQLVYCVSLADYLCSKAGRTSLGVQNVAEPPTDIRARLKLDDIGMELIKAELAHTLDRASLLAAI